MDNLSRSELEALIEEWVLSERDRMITKRKLLDGIHYETLSEEVGLSPRQVQNQEGYQKGLPFVIYTQDTNLPVLCEFTAKYTNKVGKNRPLYLLESQ